MQRATLQMLACLCCLLGPGASHAEASSEAESELRWQLHPRFSLVAFSGTGVARSEIGETQRDETVTAGGAGFRYLIARKHGMHIGLDVAAGPDEPIIYVVFGSAWLRL
jgi:hypothetical protein